jgi:hypothetical protein
MTSTSRTRLTPYPAAPPPPPFTPVYAAATPAAPACPRLMPGTLHFGCSNLRHGTAVPRLRREAGALDPSRTRPAQIFIDDDHLFFGPAQLADYIIQIIIGERSRLFGTYAGWRFAALWALKNASANSE